MPNPVLSKLAITSRSNPHHTVESVSHSPIAVASFTSILWLALVMSFVTVLSFYAVFVIANDLEDPFGTDDNDMPMLEFHEEFCASLCALLTQAWLPMDQWLVKEGKWVRPRNVALAVNAFGDKIGKCGVAFSSRDVSGRAPRPYNTLLNRAKAKKARGATKGFVALRSTNREAALLPTVVIPQSLDYAGKAIVIQRAVRDRAKSKAFSSSCAGVADGNKGRKPSYAFA